MRLPSYLKAATSKAIRRFGFDIVRADDNTSVTWLGLRHREFECIIDVGANEGQFAELALEFFPNAQIHCFEPLPEAFTRLKNLLDKQGGNQAHCYQIALGEEEGTLEFIVHKDHPTSSFFLITTELTRLFCPIVTRTAKTTVEVKTLDSILDKDALRGKSILLKCDVQGFEDRVLRGAKKTLLLIDAVMIEVNFATLYQGQAKFAEIVSRLDDAGLTFAGNVG